MLIIENSEQSSDCSMIIKFILKEGVNFQYSVGFSDFLASQWKFISALGGAPISVA
jgi:hypothetical protein